MIIFWHNFGGLGGGGGGGSSVDPGIENVRSGITYTIDGTDLVGTAQLNILTEAILIGQTSANTLE